MDLADPRPSRARRHLAVAGRRTHVTQADLDKYEGLVASTTYLWYSRCWMDEEDLRQELWLKVTQALLSYDPTRSRMSEKNYVFSLVFNRVKDFLRRKVTASELDVPHRGGKERVDISRSSIDARYTSRDGSQTSVPAGAFELQFLSLEREDASEVVAAFLPAGLSVLEVQIAVLLAMGFEHKEIMDVLACSHRRVKAAAAALRVAMADRRPPTGDPEVLGSCSGQRSAVV